MPAQAKEKKAGFPYYYLLILLLLIPIVLLMKKQLVSILVAVIIILAAIFSVYWRKYTDLPINFELNSVATVLLSYSYGLAIGLFAGITTVIVGYRLCNRMSHNMIMPMAGCFAIPFVMLFASGYGIVIAGIISVVAYNAVGYLLGTSVFRQGPYGNILAIASSLFINISIINAFAVGIVSLLG